MEQVGINGVQQVQYQPKAAATQPSFTANPPEQKEDGDKKLMNALLGLGAITAAGIGIYAGRHKLANLFSKNGKKVAEAASEAVTQPNKGAKEIAEATAEAAERIAKEQQTIQARNAQDALIEHMQNPSGQKYTQEYFDEVFSDPANIKKLNEAEEALELKNAQLALEAAIGPQANKSAKDSALVFHKAYKQEISDEAARRIESEKAIQTARQLNDVEIEKMQHPTGKSASNSAMAFLEAEYNGLNSEHKAVIAEMEKIKTQLHKVKRAGKKKKLARQLDALSKKFYVISDQMDETSKLMKNIK